MGSEWLSNVLRPYPFRGKLRLLDALTPRLGQRCASVFGLPMDLDLADSIQRHIYFGAYEPTETAMVRGWLRPGMTFVDVGANVGYFTALAASCVGSAGRVFAIEPQPYAYDRLAKFVARNSLGQARTLQAGLSSASGELPLFLPSEPAPEHNATMVTLGEGAQISVPVKTLDDCMAEWGIDRIDLLKIDVEGHEPKVFEGATKALAAGRIQAVMCEFNEFWLHHAGTSSAGLYRTLTAAGLVDQNGPADFQAGGMETRFLHLPLK
ncbi:MAG: FkbM family methyltransferase [Acidobacteriota bacterium]|nr:FkbM family methyltransferase [Acidobacteriota bacterium]